MRCNNCGWKNVGSKIRCEKCNYPLDGSLNQDQIKTDLSNDFTTQLGKTITGTESNQDPWDTPNTGKLTPTKPIIPPSPPIERPIETPIAEKPSVVNFKDTNVGNKTDGKYRPVNEKFTKTFDPSRVNTVFNKSFKLTPIAREDEQSANTLPKFFTEESVELNRSNTDANNFSITSKTQAVVEYIDGTWYLVDKSDLKTTFIQAGNPKPLKSGDIIQLGNRKFVFDE